MRSLPRVWQLSCGVLAAALAQVAAVAATPAAAQAQSQPATIIGVRIELDSLAPRLVAADSPGVLSVSGRVINGADRAVSDLDVRVQRGEPVRTDEELRSALDGAAATDSARPRFTSLPGVLPPGGAMTFRVDVPLRGGGELDSLGISEPGVYPLLVNLNGIPEFGGRARLAAVRLLLPVLGLPAAGPGLPPVTTPPTVRTPLTMLWPLVDVPRRLPNQQGQPVVLTDDGLATSLAPGGRLFGLLDAARRFAPPGDPLAPALCFAIDPDLIDTVAAIAAGGYQLADRRPGAGTEAAAAWLDQLRTVVAGRCVLALPFADVDLVALSRAGLTDLQGRARTDGAQILTDMLGARPLSGLTWPVGELLDERTLTDLAGLGDTAVILDPRGLTDPAVVAGRAAVELTTGSPATVGLRGLLVDTLAGQAVAGTIEAPQNASTTPAGSDRALSTQDGLATLALRAGTAAPGGVLLAPPRRWSVDAAEAGELLRAARQLVTAGLTEPRPLARLLAATPPTTSTTTPTTTTTISYPLQAGAAEIARSVTATAFTVRSQLRDIGEATERDPRINLDPARLLDPLHYGLLRGTSSAWRGNQPAAAALVNSAGAELTSLLQGVQIEPPAGPYLLAASNAPLLLTLNNPLPVQIDIQITLDEVPGLRTSPIDVVRVPAASRRQVKVATEVIRAGQFSVDAELATPGGTQLGPRGAASRIQLRSTAYGTVTLALTGGAAVLLVLLAGFRITRRVRAARRSSA